jgi:pimeloyl-ACP methyl ester carboxylesterase
MLELPDYLPIRPSRRHWLGMAVTIGAGALAGPAVLGKHGKTSPALAADSNARPALAPYQPEPSQPAMTRGIAAVNGAEIAYSDTGGAGEAVILLHAYTGSMEAWSYQIPALARAGYRVIAFSRRGHKGSSSADNDIAGRTVDDLSALADFLGIGSFHLIGTAAGGFLALDFAVSRAKRLRSLTIASSLAGVDDAAFNATSASLTPKSFYQLPPELRELGPSYRAAYPEGVARWVAIESAARIPGTKIPLKTRPISLPMIAQLDLPCLLLTGSADLYIPPSHMARLAGSFRRSELVIIPEAGHAAHWEQPELFNRHILHFLRRHLGPDFGNSVAATWRFTRSRRKFDCRKVHPAIEHYTTSFAPSRHQVLKERRNWPSIMKCKVTSPPSR